MDVINIVASYFFSIIQPCPVKNHKVTKTLRTYGCQQHSRVILEECINQNYLFFTKRKLQQQSHYYALCIAKFISHFVLNFIITRISKLSDFLNDQYNV